MADNDDLTNDNSPQDDNGLKPREGQSIINPLPQDNGTPFSAPTDPTRDASEEDDLRPDSGQLDPINQATDTNVDSHEAYDEGLSGAAEAEEPNAGDTVVNYNPEEDERRQP